MPSFSSIPSPIAWANNAIQERRQESLPITPAKCGNPVGRQSNFAHTSGDCPSRMGQGQTLWLRHRAGTRSISISGLLSDGESNGSVCPVIPLVRPHSAEKILATQPCAPIPISRKTIERKDGLVTRKEDQEQASLVLEKSTCPPYRPRAEDS